MQRGTRKSLALAGAAWAAAAGSLGCGEADTWLVNEVVGAVVLEAERLRPDFEPLGDELPISERATYSDGNRYAPDGSLEATGGAPLSPLFFADMPGHLVHDLHKAECLWVDRGNEAGRLSFEVVARDLRIDERTSVEEVSYCGTYLHDPVTRDVAVIRGADEDDVKTFSGAVADQLDVELTRWEGRASADPYNDCDAGDAGIQSLPVTAGSLAGIRSIPLGPPGSRIQFSYPYCLGAGAFGRIDADTRMQLDLIDLESGLSYAMGVGVDAPPLEIETRIKVVEPSAPGDEFLLSRPLFRRGAGEPDHDGDRTRIPYTWTWSVEETADGRWRENFHPALNVSRVRAYLDRGHDEDTGDRIREYIDPRRIRAYTGFEDGAPVRQLNCRVKRRDPDLPPACDDVEGLTPTFRRHLVAGRDSLSGPLTWEVRFDRVLERRPVEQPDGSIILEEVEIEPAPPYDRGDPLFIEFHLVRPSHGTSSSGLTVSPGVRDLGDLQVADNPDFRGAVEIQNFGQGNLQIEDVQLSGPDAQGFSWRVAGGLPQTLAPGASLPIDLALVHASSHHGRLELQVEVQGRNAAGHKDTVRASVVANAVDWIFGVMHPPLVFDRFVGQSPFDDVAAFEKPLLVQNLGTLAMPRGQITITGPGADHFSVLRADSEWLPPDDYHPWLWGEPPTASHEIEPGENELLFVVYHPRHPGIRELRHGSDEAEVRIRVGDVDYQVPLRGYCLGQCEFRAPEPAGPASEPGGVVWIPGLAPEPAGGLQPPHEGLHLEVGP